MSQTPDHHASNTNDRAAQPQQQQQHHPDGMPVTNGKRRLSAAHASAAAMSPSPPPSLKASLAGSPPSQLDELRTSANRRRRLVSYSIALATLVALSSVMERRTSLNAHHAKIQLSLPSSSSLSSLSDAGVTTSSDSALVPHAPAPVDLVHSSAADAAPPAPPHNPVAAPPVLPAEPRDRDERTDGAAADPPPREPHDEAQQQAPSAGTAAADDAAAPDAPSAAAAPTAQKPVGVNVSDQELKDSVDQLIAHVDQEAEQSASSGNSTTPNADEPLSASGGHVPPGVEHYSSNSSNLPSGAAPGAADATPGTADGVTVSGSVPDASSAGSALEAGRLTAAGATPSGASSEESRLNSQEHFDSAQKRLQAMMSDDGVRALVDENDHRTLQALALQATRGDCEQKSGASRSLFKTDAEAAANEDVERTEPLWGAWCLFMGSYKSDAMRDFVTKLRVVEDKVSKLRAAASETGNATVPADHDDFDPNAASLDDVLTSDQQSALRSQMETISTHLTDEDRRYLAALSLQATFGDCGPYGREATAAAEALRRDAGDEHAELRKLREPLLDETVSRRAGALWGAWCVMQGKKRTAAANELTSRVELLVDQLSSKSRAAAAAASSAGSAASAGSVVPSSMSAVLPGSDTSSPSGAAPASLAGKPPDSEDADSDTEQTDADPASQAEETSA